MIYKLSVIIPVFNDQARLNKCLSALESQVGINSRDIQIIVVDNSSSVPVTIPDSLVDRTVLLVCSKKGSYAARNTGASVADGEWIAFMDADCWPAPDWAANALKTMHDINQPCCLGGEVLFQPSAKPTAVEAYQLLTGFGQRSNITQQQFAATANLFVHSRVFKEVGTFNEDLLSGGDRDWSWRAIEKGFLLLFCEGAIVYTKARRSLRGAITQARRVAGGRRGLKKIFSANDTSLKVSVRPPNGVGSKIKLIMNARQFSIWMRFQVLIYALLIRFSYETELFRLSLGGMPERR